MAVRFGFSNLKLAPSPCNPREKISPEGDPFDDITCYHQIIGVLLWIARTTRPDILFITGLLARFQQCPTVRHYGAAKHVIRYLIGMAKYGIMIR